MKRIVCLILAICMIAGAIISTFSMFAYGAFVPVLGKGHTLGGTGVDAGEAITVTSVGDLPPSVFTTEGSYTFTVASIDPTNFDLQNETPTKVSGASLSQDLSTITFHNIRVVKRKSGANEPWKVGQTITVQIEPRSVTNLSDAPVVNKQRITAVNKETSELSTFRRGNRGDIRLTVTDTNKTTSDFAGGESALITGGAFKTDDKSTMTILPQTTGNGLTFDIVFGNVIYTGIGKTTNFRLLYTTTDGEKVRYDSTVTFNEYRFQEYKEPTSDPDDDKEEEEKVLDPLVPHIIVDSYDYGGKNVTAGDVLTLNMIIKNTSDEFDLENIVMKVTPPDAFSIASSSNSFYIEFLKSGRTMERSIEISVKPDAKPESHNIAIAFDFQYVANEKRVASKSEENIAIPVTQIDRFSINNVDAPGVLYVGDEYPMSASLINKGKSPVYNVVAELILSNGSPKQSQFIGNVESGKEASADFFLSGKENGELTGEVLIHYEDSNMNLKTLKHTISVVIEGGYEEPGGENIGGFEPMDPVEPVVAEPDNSVRNVLIFCGVVMTLLSTYTTVMKIKAKRSEFADDDI